jgi:hypothetical protein
MPVLANFAGIWRQGSVLVMHKKAPLPDICLKSNKPAKGRLVRKLQWHNPALALTIVLGVLVYLILALIVTKKATLRIPLSDEWLARRKSRMLIAWGIAAAGLLLCVLGIVLAGMTDRGEFALLLILGFFMMIGAAIYGQYACRMVWPKRITDEYVWLKGVNPEFLDRLEVFPYQV